MEQPLRLTISGLPLIGFNENSIIEFRSERRNETTGGPGTGGPEINHIGFTTVGTARVVDITSNEFMKMMHQSVNYICVYSNI